MSSVKRRRVQTTVTLCRNRSKVLENSKEVQPYRGDGENVSVEAWLSILERVARRNDYDNDDKKIMLEKYLRDSALEWFAFMPENEV